MTPTPAAASLLLLCLLPTPVSASTQNVWAVILKVCSIIAFEGFTGIHSDDATLLLKFHSVMTYVCVAVILGASFYSEYSDGYEGAKTVFRLVTCGAYEPEGFMERCGAAPVICIIPMCFGMIYYAVLTAISTSIFLAIFGAIVGIMSGLWFFTLPWLGRKAYKRWQERPLDWGSTVAPEIEQGAGEGGAGRGGEGGGGAEELVGVEGQRMVRGED